MISSSVRMTGPSPGRRPMKFTAAILRVAAEFSSAPKNPSPSQMRARMEGNSRRCLQRRRACPIHRAPRQRSQSISFVLVTEQRHRFAAPRVPAFHCPSSRACRNWSPTHRADPTCGSPFRKIALWSSARFAPDTGPRPGSKSPVRVLITKPAVGVKHMLVSILYRRARGHANHCRDAPGSLGRLRRRVAETGELFHEIRIGKP